MVGRKCHSCEKVIGHLDKSFVQFGCLVCEACNAKIENPFEDPGITDASAETEVPIAEAPIKEDRHVKRQAPAAEGQAAADLPQKTETKIPIAEAPSEENRDVRCQASVTEDQAAANLSQRNEEIRYYGGIDRTGYFFGMCGLSAVCTILYAAVQANLGIIVLSQIVVIPVSLALVVSRLHNIGMGVWWSLLMVVPVVNLFIVAKCTLCPEGYHDTEKLDAAGKIIAGIFIGFALLLIVTGVIIWRKS